MCLLASLRHSNCYRWVVSSSTGFDRYRIAPVVQWLTY